MRRPVTPFRHLRLLLLFGTISFCLWIAIRILRASACHALLARSAKAVCNTTLSSVVVQLPLVFVGVELACVL